MFISIGGRFFCEYHPSNAESFGESLLWVNVDPQQVTEDQKLECCAWREEHTVEQHIIEEHTVEQHIIEEYTVEQHIIEEHTVEQHIIE